MEGLDEMNDLRLCMRCMRGHMELKWDRATGERFWGCTNFGPGRCKYTVKVNERPVLVLGHTREKDVDGWFHGWSATTEVNHDTNSNIPGETMGIVEYLNGAVKLVHVDKIQFIDVPSRAPNPSHG